MDSAPILAYIDTLKEELTWIRRDIHQHPEVLFDVPRTADMVAELLEQYGLEVQRQVGRHFGSGVVGLLRGSGEGRMVLLRADMDALPIQEETGAAYSSRHAGIMHACGHDAHTAMLLGAAKALSRFRNELHGTVKFVFQPAEEGTRQLESDGRLISGGRDMIEAGILEGVDMSFAMHVWPDLPAGTLGLHKKEAMAASSHFTVRFHGVSGHHSSPHLAADAILMAAQFINEIKLAMTTMVDPLEPAVLSFGTLNAGTVLNAIADHSEIKGSFRAFHPDVVDRITHKIQKTAELIALQHGGTSEVIQRTGTLLSNDSHVRQLAEQAGHVVFGKSGVQELRPILAGEDFALYTEQVPGTFAFLGSSRDGCHPIYPIHHSKFELDESILTLGAKLHVQFVFEALGEEQEEREVAFTAALPFERYVNP
ncbi:amidohydrolase [Paenibacillus zeisoli]|uniref:Amidohydrolase n=1 Tax=Paenibacillus zeisoli TaxID=2496267 RepID=A0A3S1D7Q0_9BACL|nr:amidohydrolase [Paenibacillus zeisoli]RUT28969.1 amidohydrolase [Paenibacillus zeisoli]